MKFETPEEMVDFTVKTMEAIARDPASGGVACTIRRVAVASNSSRSAVEKFYYGSVRNPTMDQLSKIMAGIKKVKLELAGA